MNKYTDEYLDQVYYDSIQPYLHYVIQWYNQSAHPIDKKRAIFPVDDRLKNMISKYTKPDIDLQNTMHGHLELADGSFALWLFFDKQIILMVSSKDGKQIYGKIEDNELIKKLLGHIKLLATRYWNTNIIHYIDNIYNIMYKINSHNTYTETGTKDIPDLDILDSYPKPHNPYNANFYK